MAKAPTTPEPSGTTSDSERIRALEERCAAYDALLSGLMPRFDRTVGVVCEMRGELACIETGYGMRKSPWAPGITYPNIHASVADQLRDRTRQVIDTGGETT